MGEFIPQYRTARSAHEIMVGDPAEAVERESRGPVGQDRTAVVGAFGVPSVACEKAGNEGPVLALCGPADPPGERRLSGIKRKWLGYHQTDAIDP